MPSGCESPPRRRLRRGDDIPLDFSDLPAVKEMITRNNRKTKLKQRLKTSDFVSESFSELGSRALVDRSFVSVAADFLEECSKKNAILPSSSSIAKVLYLFLDKGLAQEGRKLAQQLLQAYQSLGVEFVDEKVATVSLRLLTEGNEVNLGLINRFVEMIPEGSHRRRLFFPLLECAARTGDVALAFDTLHFGRQRNIEFWDVDYSKLLQCLQNTTENANISALTTELLECMTDHHPVVGRANGEALQQLLGGELTEVCEKTGKCGRCGAHLNTFDLDEEERAALLGDIETKLVVPHVQDCSPYDMEEAVEPMEKGHRWKEFEDFKEVLSLLDYDGVIDGANVGYYGLSSWYSEAKKKMLQASGADLSTVPEYDLCEVPFPVDVPPKFSLVDDMLREARRLRKNSVIMLHSRHFKSPPEENLPWIAKWKREKALVVCPGFLNDDYCWLFAAVYRPNCLVFSNDQMRDHHFTLSGRSFLRWRQRHLVRYVARFNPVIGTAALHLTLPRPYAIWVQRGKVSQSHWHVPVRTTLDVIDQATNRRGDSEADVDKDGDDPCDAWLCTADVKADAADT